MLSIGSKDCWFCGYQSFHMCHEVIAHRGSLEDIHVTLLK